MVARSYRDLVVFQRSADLRRLVMAMIAAPAAARDFKYCNQVRDAVRSPPRNIAEGFGRYNPSEFAQFLDVAIASLDELDNHLRDGAEQRYFPPERAAEAIHLCARCRWMAVRLRQYLHREAERRRRRPKHRPPTI
jgi:four helix bundle protein